MRISDWSSDVCSSDLPLFRRNRRCVVGQRMRQAGQHFPGADLPEAATHAIPVGNDGGGPFAVGLARLLLHQCLADILPMGGGKALPDDAVRIGATLEIAVRITEIGSATCRERVCQTV